MYWGNKDETYGWDTVSPNTSTQQLHPPWLQAAGGAWWFLWVIVWREAGRPAVLTEGLLLRGSAYRCRKGTSAEVGSIGSSGWTDTQQSPSHSQCKTCSTRRRTII